MAFEVEQKILDDFVKNKGLKHSSQRKDILMAFLRTEKHLTAEELYSLVRKKNPAIGIATVYRTLKLFCDCGLSRELRLGSEAVRYEHLYGHEHHDHLVCLTCGDFIEVVDPEIEHLQEKLARKEGFTLQGHKLIMYGICQGCKE
ncbi:MAG: transcriptional repressor [Nitrospiraceae bacterium]|nr:MAG: transcriptional repressor [Nitrospiraceae bacterium]